MSASLAGCSGNGAMIPSLPQLTGGQTEATIVGSPTEVYERIARGALSCWFGTKGPLKANFVYHAEAEPPGKGGKAEIAIHERDRKYEGPKGPRAYRIVIESESDKTTLTFENLKLPDPLAASMEADARRWGSGEVGCTEVQSGGWSENTPNPSPAKDGKAKDVKAKHAPKSN